MQDKPREPQPTKWGRFSRTASFWILIVATAVLITQVFSRPEQPEELTYTEFTQQLAAGNLGEVTVIGGKRIEGRLTSPIAHGQTSVQDFWVELPVKDSEQLIADLETRNVPIKAAEPKPNWWILMLQALPWLLIIGFWIFMLRQMQAGGSKAFQFGKSKARLLTGDTPKVTFADVAGADEAKDELQEIIEFLKDPQKFSRLGGRLPKGVLLVGPPGTGKTLLARAVAGEAGRPFFSMSGSDFVEMFVGVGASRVRDLFEQGKAHA
ncbi:MAG TPA: ATP-dependent metallopeptidase FtsH/Yme1/Tma family protein, partial [Longimicrobiales bacterium]|nr:ATP-dependent metallopeptidase FtsH/Yme1/Tma family protein [Longimicrobiales bacterium]